jgi:hypothetical protein
LACLLFDCLPSGARGTESALRCLAPPPLSAAAPVERVEEGTAGGAAGAAWLGVHWRGGVPQRGGASEGGEAAAGGQMWPGGAARHWPKPTYMGTPRAAALAQLICGWGEGAPRTSITTTGVPGALLPRTWRRAGGRRGPPAVRRKWRRREPRFGGGEIPLGSTRAGEGGRGVGWLPFGGRGGTGVPTNADLLLYRAAPAPACGRRRSGLRSTPIGQ